MAHAPTKTITLATLYDHAVQTNAMLVEINTKLDEVLDFVRANRLPAGVGRRPA